MEIAPTNNSILINDLFLEEIGVLQKRVELIVLERNGKVEKWPENSTLTYEVVSNSFDTLDDYQKVVDRMSQAAQAWESACGIHFRHLQDFDAKELHYANGIPAEVTFAVLLDDTIRPAFATSFFPHNPASHKLRVSKSYFTDECYYDHVGIFRHELGHIMGFRHEQAHKDAPRACWPKNETIVSKGLTPYDSKSVMHYLCTNVGTTTLELTALDVQGALKLYPKH